MGRYQISASSNCQRVGARQFSRHPWPLACGLCARLITSMRLKATATSQNSAWLVSFVANSASRGSAFSRTRRCLLALASWSWPNRRAAKSAQEKGARKAPLNLSGKTLPYATSVSPAASSASRRARSPAPLAAVSRSTNSMTAIAALSPGRKPAFMMRK